jgi:hypothetical protein
MSSKSRHKRGKHSFQGKKRKDRRTPVVTATETPVAAQAYTPAASSQVVAPSARVPTPTPRPAMVKHPYVASELRRIGITAGIMLAALAILSVALP